MTKFLRFIFVAGVTLLLCACSSEKPDRPPESWATVTEDGEAALPITPSMTFDTVISADDDGRLTEYDVTLDIDPSERLIDAREKITYRNRTGADLDEIALAVRLGELNVTEVSVFSEPVEFDFDGGVISVRLDEPLQAGKDVEIAIKFDARIPITSGNAGANEHALWLGDFLPSPMDFYGALFANFTVNVTTPEGYSVVGTGDEDWREFGGERITTVKAANVREFALSVSGEYECYTIKTDKGKYINVYAYTDGAETIARAAKSALDGLSEYLGNYRDSTLDIVETGFCDTADCESFSTIIFADEKYFAKEPPYYELQDAVCAQWFGGVIDLTEPWLERALPRFVRLTALSSEKQARESISADEDGAELMIFNLKAKMGDSAFNDFIKTFLSRYSYKTAMFTDFETTLREFCDEDLNEIFKEIADMITAASEGEK